MKRVPVDTAEDLKAKASIHDKEVELTYLRMGANISAADAKETRVSLRHVLRAGRRMGNSLAIAGDQFEDGLRGIVRNINKEQE